MRADEREFDGTDATGAIRVVVNLFGMVTDVVVARNWREKMPPRQLALAMTTAVNNALTNRLVDELTHTDLEPEATPREGARDARGNPSGAVARDLKAEIAGLLATFDRDLETYRRELCELAGATVSARSPKGAVEVTMGHGQAVQVTVDPTWAKSARHNDVRAETLAACRAAGQRLATVPRAVTPPPSMVRLRELAGDTAALNRELGLS
jgi:DNA-binding protein YbaB